MKNWIATLALGGFLWVNGAAANENFSMKCPDISTCAKAVSELTGQKYLMESDIKGTTLGTPNLEINKDNAELLFTLMLHLNGYTRVPVDQPKTYWIQKERDARDTLLPVFVATRDREPQFPNTYDLSQMHYTASFPDAVEVVAKNLRSFLPANSRVIPSEVSGQLLLTASVPDLKNCYRLIREMDRKPSPELKAKWERLRQEDFKKRLEEAKSGKGRDT